VLLDAIFQPVNFRNEVIWKRTSGHSDAHKYGRVHDALLYYTKGPNPTWNQVYQAYDQAYIDQYYRYKDPDGRRWMSGDAGAAGLQGGGYEYDWKGKTRIWRMPEETMERLDSQGRIFYTKNGMPRIKRYLDESKGMPVQDIWSDVEALRSWHAEKLGYQTQKPLALLERVLRVSSNPGDIVLDPFCGCGTTIDAAQKLGRQWVGIDITPIATTLIRHRLADSFGTQVQYKVIGEPGDLAGAEQLAKDNPHHFQAWALGQVNARPIKVKMGADEGIDGRIYFHDEFRGQGTKQMIASVKGGKLKATDVRDLAGTVTREKAEMGALITLHPPTDNMLKDAAQHQFYESPLWQKRYPKIQIVTIADLLNGGTLNMPPRQATGQTLKRAPSRQKDEIIRPTLMKVAEDVPEYDDAPR
jgi:hypothetical protein